MRILFCTAELIPFSHVGGLAEFSARVPAALRREGLDVTIITPLYRQINRKVTEINPCEYPAKTEVRLGHETHPARFHYATLPGTDVPVIFIENDTFFGRDGIYTNPSNGIGFADNPRRFAFFQKAVIGWAAQVKPAFDLLHVNDHHTALLPAMLKSGLGDATALEQSKTLLTMHNVAFQGDCEETFADTIGLSPSLFEPDGPYRRNSRLNYLKAGVLFADKVVTVSTQYAEETRSDPEQGYGLQPELAGRGDDYIGILNGVDYSAWEPKSDELIVENFSPANMTGKRACKKELLARNGLDSSNLDIPTIGMITRLTDSQGFDLLRPVFDKLMSFDLTLVMMGTGDPKYHKLFESIKMRFPHKFGLNLIESNRIAHTIMAGSDFLLMPSRFEPCGTHQMYAMRYGAVPIVRATGGLADSVKDVDETGSDGWGFRFSTYDSTELLKTVWRAVSFYKNKKMFKRITKRAMEQSFTWDHTASHYLDTYRSLLG